MLLSFPLIPATYLGIKSCQWFKMIIYIVADATLGKIFKDYRPGCGNICNESLSSDTLPERGLKIDDVFVVKGS